MLAHGTPILPLVKTFIVSVYFTRMGGFYLEGV